MKSNPKRNAICSVPFLCAHIERMPDKTIIENVLFANAPSIDKNVIGYIPFLKKERKTLGVL